MTISSIGRNAVIGLVVGVIGSLIATYIWFAYIQDDPPGPSGSIESPDAGAEVGLTQDVGIVASFIPKDAELWILVSKSNCAVPHGDSEPGQNVEAQAYKFDDVQIGNAADEDGRWTIELVMAEGPDASAEFTDYNRDPESPDGRCPRPAGLTRLDSIQVTRERGPTVTTAAPEPTARFISPFDGEEIPYPVDVVVEVDDGIPDQFTLWIVTKTNGLWPAWPLPPIPPQQVFEGLPVLEEGQSGIAELLLVLADEEAHAAFQAYTDKASAEGWINPMEEMPPSAIIVDRIGVRR